MADERHATVARYDEPETDKTKIGSFLLRVTTLRDGRLVVARVDVGREVRHVKNEPGEIEVEGPDHLGDDPPLDLDGLALGDRVHRVPGPPVVEGAPGDAYQMVAGGLCPPLREGELRAGVTDPVQGGERDVGPDRAMGI